MRLSSRQRDGSTLREHLQAAADATGTPDPFLTVPHVPRGCVHLLSAFTDLSGARIQGFGGGGLIPPSEVRAWCELHRVELTPWELETIAAMDRASLSVMHEARKANA